jgi:hypothetical protein
MGELINIAGQVSDSQIPQAIARDTETAAAIAAHEGKLDPHPVYLTQDEADVRYRQSSTSTPIYTGSALPAANVAGNSIGLGWNSVQPGLGIAELCNYSGTGGGDAFNFFRTPGNATSPPTLSQRVARIDISGAYIQSSDARLKSHFSEAPGLKVIMALNPVRYKHWDCIGEGTSLKLEKNCLHKIGFVAQEVKQHIPEAVPATSSETELYGLDYSCIIACLVRAVQEQQHLIDELRTQLLVKR